MGRKSPPPPTIIMPPPPPPPQVITDVTPQESYSDAADYLRRLDDREKAIEARRWSAGETPGAIRSSHAAVNLRAAEDAMKYGNTAPEALGSQASFGGLSIAKNLWGTRQTMLKACDHGSNRQLSNWRMAFTASK